MTKIETVPQEALRLLSEIPEKEFIVNEFTNGENKCCAIGHYERLKSENPDDYSLNNCADIYTQSHGRKLRDITGEYIRQKYDIHGTIAFVNNSDDVNGYNQKTPKARVIALLKDMVKDGY